MRGPFARATVTSFFFSSSLNCFILLPLYVHHLGGTEADIGLVQGIYFLAGLLAGSAHGFLYPALAALLMDLTLEARRGSAVGVFSAVLLAGNALGSIVFGFVAHGLGYGVMWTALTFLLAAGFGLSLRLLGGYPVRAPRGI